MNHEDRPQKRTALPSTGLKTSTPRACTARSRTTGSRCAGSSRSPSPCLPLSGWAPERPGSDLYRLGRSIRGYRPGCRLCRNCHSLNTGILFCFFLTVNAISSIYLTASHYPALGDGLMVRRRTLTPLIEVRALVPQPRKFKHLQPIAVSAFSFLMFCTTPVQLFSFLSSHLQNSETVGGQKWRRCCFLSFRAIARNLVLCRRRFLPAVEMTEGGMSK